MTVWYTPREDRLLEEDRAKDIAIEQQVGRKPDSPADRERIWKAIQDASRS